MTTYIVNCPVQEEQAPCGPFGSLAEAQVFCQSSAEARVATDPSNLSLQSTSTLYVVIKTRTNQRNTNGINYTSSNQMSDRQWKIVALVNL